MAEASVDLKIDTAQRPTPLAFPRPVKHRAIQKPFSADRPSSVRPQPTPRSDLTHGLLNWYLGPLRKYVDFSGRASQKEFWLFLLSALLLTIVVVAVGESLAWPDAALSIAGSHFLLLITPYWALMVRRLHDSNRSGAVSSHSCLFRFSGFSYTAT